MSDPNYYEVLQIPPDASQEELRRVYYLRRDLALSQADGKLLAELEMAYLVLGKPELRKAYNAEHGFPALQGDGQAHGTIPEPDVQRMSDWLREANGPVEGELLKQKMRDVEAPKSEKLHPEDVAAVVFAVVIVLALAAYSGLRLFRLVWGDLEPTWWRYAFSIGGLLLSVLVFVGWCLQKSKK